MSLKDQVTHANWKSLDTPGFHAAFEDALESVLRESAMRQCPIVIGNELVEASPGPLDRSPGDPSITLGSTFVASAGDVNEAFAAAVRAFGEWSASSYADRVSSFRRLATLIERDRFAIAALLSLEIGKTRFEAMTEVAEAVALIENYASDMMSNDGYVHPFEPLGDERSVSVLRPYGAWAVLGPANFPFGLVVGMSAAAVICGNTVVVKPPEDAPLPALTFAKLAIEAGFPPGVVNVLTGSAETGRLMVSHPDLRGVVFTGSARVGAEIVTSLASRGVPVIAEMGGKNACVVGASADLDIAARGIALSAFRYSGQKCSACSRVFAVEDVAAELADRIVEESYALTVGVPWEQQTVVGSLINHRAVDRYRTAVATATRDARSLRSGSLPSGLPTDGAYAPFALTTDLPAGHPLLIDELFVPFCTIQTATTFEDAILSANDTMFGLTAGAYTQDQSELDLFYRLIEAGVVYSNRPSGATTGAWVGHQSFGGWKASGSTGKNAHGPYYLPLFMREQSQTRA
jgi:1-pyrroline-5-carboxylate dehydrogenase